MTLSCTTVELFKENLRILIVDDDLEICGLLHEMLEQLGHVCVTAFNGFDALETLAKNQFDLLITDIKMPRMDGIELTRRVKSNFRDVDVIAITAHTSEYKYTDVIQAGASDFVTKPFTQDELEAKIKRILRERFLLSELKQLSTHDGLTGLYNRRFFDENIRHEAARAVRQHYELYLLLIDVDNFKYYNDTHGHQQGDSLLRELANIILDNIRKEVDSGYRYGGDEFAVILPHTSREQASVVAERLLAKYNQRNLHPTSLSVGIAKLHNSRGSLSESINTLIQEADRALYLGKQMGRNQVCNGGKEVVSARSSSK